MPLTRLAQRRVHFSPIYPQLHKQPPFHIEVFSISPDLAILLLWCAIYLLLLANRITTANVILKLS